MQGFTVTVTFGLFGAALRQAFVVQADRAELAIAHALDLFHQDVAGARNRILDVQVLVTPDEAIVGPCRPLELLET